MRKNKKFRFQLLNAWLTASFEPCRVADVGGGKGLLSYLLNQEGWDSTVIDPIFQALPLKYKSLADDRTIKLDLKESVKHITKEFCEDFAKHYDLIIGLHAHGSNMMIIDACKKYNKDFILLPCCVIDEPVEKKEDINWRESLVDHASSLGFDVKRVLLNFKGKNMILHSQNILRPKHEIIIPVNTVIPFDIRLLHRYNEETSD